MNGWMTMILTVLGFISTHVLASDTSCTYMANQMSHSKYATCTDCHYFFCPSIEIPRSREDYYECDPGRVGLNTASLVKGKSVVINSDQLLSKCKGPNKKQSEKKLLQQYEKIPPKFVCIYSCENPACPKELLPYTQRVTLSPEKHPEMKTFKDAVTICQGFARTDPPFDICVGVKVDEKKRELIFDPIKVSADYVGGCVLDEVFDRAATSDQDIESQCNEKCRARMASYSNAMNFGGSGRQRRTERRLDRCQDRCRNKLFTR